MSADVQRIPLRVSSKKAYVWDIDDIAALRSKHHICGVLTGTLAGLSQQNAFLGVPLVLLPEEVVLLVQNEVAILIDDPKAHVEAPIPALQRWDAERQESAKRQISVHEAKEAAENADKSRGMSEAAIQKRKVREEKRAAEKAKAAALAGEEGIFAPAPVESVAPSSTPALTAGNVPPTPHTVAIPAASSTLEWYSPDAYVHATLESAKKSGIWTYPETLSDRAKCGVFRGLWDQGYYMGGGIKFGGDYLVYPGDPLRYHSHFSASVIDSPTSSLRPMEIVAHGRLGTATKKAHLLCGWDDAKAEVSYFSIEWSGFG